jgi:hypothetical protein
MRLTAVEVERAFMQAGREGLPMRPISFERVAEILNQRLDPDPVGRKADPAGQALAPEPGRCRICGCTELHACLVPTGSAGPGFDDRRSCGWNDWTRTLCDNPPCVKAAAAARAA